MIMSYQNADIFEVGDRVQYLGSLYPKGSYTVTKIKKDRHRTYYSIVSDDNSKIINYILPIVLRRADNESEEINNG